MGGRGAAKAEGGWQEPAVTGGYDPSQWADEDKEDAVPDAWDAEPEKPKPKPKPKPKEKAEPEEPTWEEELEDPEEERKRRKQREMESDLHHAADLFGMGAEEIGEVSKGPADEDDDSDSDDGEASVQAAPVAQSKYDATTSLDSPEAARDFAKWLAQDLQEKKMVCTVDR